jgi:ABC-type multidrug transport system ATPase subunit
MRQLIQHLSKDHGKTILISSHLLYEIEQIATRMLIIHKGTKMAEGLVTDLLRPEETLVEVHIRPNETIAGTLKATEWQQYIQSADSTQLVLKMSPELMPVLNRWLVEQGVQVTELKSRHSLEAYFLSLTNDIAHVKA